MAKLVLGTNKQTVVPAVVRDMSPAHYIEKTVDANGVLNNAPSFINLDGVVSIGANVFTSAYKGCAFPANTQVSFYPVQKLSGSNCCTSMFSNATGITSVDFSSLTEISGGMACYEMFIGVSSITSVNLSGLVTISGSSSCQNMFHSCTNLTTVDLSSLTTINGYSPVSNMFTSCTSLTEVDFSSLTTMAGSTPGAYMFYAPNKLRKAKMNKLSIISTKISQSYAAMFSCQYLENLELGGLKASTFASAVNQLDGIVSSVTGSSAPNGCTIHFPSNFDPSDPNHTFDASTLTGYPTFGGNANYIHVAFDLPATES